MADGTNIGPEIAQPKVEGPKTNKPSQPPDKEMAKAAATIMGVAEKLGINPNTTKALEDATASLRKISADVRFAQEDIEEKLAERLAKGLPIPSTPQEQSKYEDLMRKLEEINKALAKQGKPPIANLPTSPKDQPRKGWLRKIFGKKS